MYELSILIKAKLPKGVCSTALSCQDKNPQSVEAFGNIKSLMSKKLNIPHFKEVNYRERKMKTF